MTPNKTFAVSLRYNRMAETFDQIKGPPDPLHGLHVLQSAQIEVLSRIERAIAGHELPIIRKLPAVLRVHVEITIVVGNEAVIRIASKDCNDVQTALVLARGAKALLERIAETRHAAAKKVQQEGFPPPDKMPVVEKEVENESGN